MQLTVLKERHIRLETEGEGFEVAGGRFGPLEMLAASLALCTASVVSAYGETAGLDLTGFHVEVQWDYTDAPRRVSSYALTLLVPAAVPVARHQALLRAADSCAVHQTLRHPPQFTSTVVIRE